MIGVSVPRQYKPLEVADLPFVVQSGAKVSTGAGGSIELRCQGFRAEDAGTVTVTMKLPGQATATTHVLPVNALSGMQWLGDIKSITAFAGGTTKIWLYLTDQFSD